MKVQFCSTITKQVIKAIGEYDEVVIPVNVEASICGPDRSVGLNSPWAEDVTVTDNDGGEVEFSEAECERFEEEAVKEFYRSQNDGRDDDDG